MDVENSGPSYGCHVGPQDRMIMNRIMLRFRPIAPKPVADGSGPGSKPENEKAEPVSRRRGKRKYVRVKKNRKCKNSAEKEERKDGSDNNGSIVTLQLLPESSSSVTNPTDNVSFQKEISFSELDQPQWMSFHEYDNNGISAFSSTDRLDLKVVLNCVIVSSKSLIICYRYHTLLLNYIIYVSTHLLTCSDFLSWVKHIYFLVVWVLLRFEPIYDL